LIKIIGIDDNILNFYIVTNYTYLFRSYQQYNKYNIFKKNDSYDFGTKKYLHDFGTDLGRNFGSLKIIPNLSKKLKRKLIRTKIPSESTVFSQQTNEYL